MLRIHFDKEIISIQTGKKSIRQLEVPSILEKIWKSEIYIAKDGKIREFVGVGKIPPFSCSIPLVRKKNKFAHLYKDNNDELKTINVHIKSHCRVEGDIIYLGESPSNTSESTISSVVKRSKNATLSNIHRISSKSKSMSIKPTLFDLKIKQ